MTGQRAQKSRPGPGFLVSTFYPTGTSGSTGEGDWRCIARHERSVEERPRGQNEGDVRVFNELGRCCVQSLGVQYNKLGSKKLKGSNRYIQ